MMKKIHLLLYVVCICFNLNSQINVVGHTIINNTPIKQVNIFVKVDGVVTKTLNTQSKSDFKLALDFGKVYEIYFQHSKSPIMHMQVIANTIPPEKYEYLMVYELNVPFVYKSDEDVDTTVFKEPFCKVIFNGGKKMIDDTAYNSSFSKTILRKPLSNTKEINLRTDSTNKANNSKTKEVTAIIAGKVLLNGNPKLAVKNKAITLVSKNGTAIRSTYTNRFGAFVFSGITTDQVSTIKLDIKELTGSDFLSLVTSNNTSVSISKPGHNLCEWTLNGEQITKMVDNHFTTNIGGKLISSSSKEKKFYAKKEVYLLNEYNTIIKKTNTNLFGTFVFEDIKPDHRYFIGTDPSKTPGERIDLLSKEDDFIGILDSLAGGKQGIRVVSNYNKIFNAISIGEEEMKMDVNATIYGDNINTPIGKLKIILLNDNYEVIDSAITDNFGTFKFKYLPFLKRFYLSAENTDNILDVFKDIIVYSNDDNLLKIMTHQKGSKFSYKPVSAELSRMRDLELEDPWLELLDENKPNNDKPHEPIKKRSITPAQKLIIENILFETAKHDITPQSKEILDKIILVLNTNQKLKIEVGAHTDSKGSEASNLQLSKLRAKTVQDYISKSGIDISRIHSVGYGESQLLNNCTDDVPCSEIEHAQNRRIEFKIIGE